MRALECSSAFVRASYVHARVHMDALVLALGAAHVAEASRSNVLGRVHNDARARACVYIRCARIARWLLMCVYVGMRVPARMDALALINTNPHADSRALMRALMRMHTERAHSYGT
jgi:hypothetical protein